MRIVHAWRVLWFALVAPTRIPKFTSEAVMATFAVAVLIVSLVSASAALYEESNPALNVETASLIPQALTWESSVEGNDIDLSPSSRRFTASFGGALMVTIISSLALAGLFMFLTRFLTDAPVGFMLCLAGVSASGLIQVVDVASSTAIHSMFDTIQAGLNAGVFVSPTEKPLLFSWLQRFSIGSLWQYIVIAIAIVSWGGLHARFGIVVGAIVWILTRLLLGGFALVGWIVSHRS